MFERFQTILCIPSAESGHEETTIRFCNLEDFHPDSLVHQIEPLSRLYELRAKLLDPARAEAAVAESRIILKMPVTGDTPVPASSIETTDNLLTRLMGKPSSSKTEKTPNALTIEQLIKQIVAPSLVDGPTTEQSRLVQRIEFELSTCLRNVLHHPDFQALESAWRGIDFLVREIDDQIKVYLIDITKAELASKVLSSEWAKTAIFKQLEQMEPAILLGNFTFGLEDQPLLGAISAIAEALRTSFVAAASPEMVGCRSFGLQPDPDDWANAPAPAEIEALRRLPQSSHLGLLMPRFLLRQPYGSDPIEAFPFQEVLSLGDHESYLWGNPCFLCGYLMADAFLTQGGPFDSPDGGQIIGLPVHTLTADGETKAKPCGEAWLSEKAAWIIRNHGIMPVVSIRGRDAVEIGSLHAFSMGAGPLMIRER